MYKLVKIDEKTSDEMWQGLFVARNNYGSDHEGCDCKMVQELKNHLLNEYQECDKAIRYAFIDANNQVVGDFECYINDGETENIGAVIMPEIYLAPELQTDEVVRLVLNMLIQHYDNSLKMRLISWNGEYDHWAEKWGGTFKIHLENHKLKCSDLDVKKLTNWAETSKTKNPDLKLRICEMKELTENELVEYLHLWNTGLDSSLTTNKKCSDVIKKYNFKYQIPVQVISKDFINDDRTVLVIIVYDIHNKMVGITHIDVNFKMPKEYINGKLVAEYLVKGMTYVKPDYRGHGLGKWMNSELYLKLLDSYVFEEIESEMVPYNRYILNINHEFGYKKKENDYHKEYIFELSEIKKLLQLQPF